MFHDDDVYYYYIIILGLIAIVVCLLLYSSGSSGAVYHRPSARNDGSVSSSEDKVSCRSHSAAAGSQPTSRRSSGTFQCLSEVISSFGWLVCHLLGAIGKPRTLELLLLFNHTKSTLWTNKEHIA